MTQSTEWLSVNQVADQLQCNPQTVRAYIRDGLLTVFQPAPGKKIRISAEAVTAMLNGGRRNAETR